RLRLLEVESNGAPPTRENIGASRNSRTPQVAASRPIYPDHVGAQIRKQHAAERHWSERRKLDDLQIAQWATPPPGRIAHTVTLPTHDPTAALAPLPDCQQSDQRCRRLPAATNDAADCLESARGRPRSERSFGIGAPRFEVIEQESFHPNALGHE